MAMILVTLFVGDHPRLFAATRHQHVVLDAAYTDERELEVRLGQLLGAEILTMKVKKVDLVSDTTTVDVRYRLIGASSMEGVGLHDATVGAGR